MLHWFIAAALAATPVALRDVGPVVRADRVVRIGDVVDAARLPAALARRIVLRLPAHRQAITLSRVALASLVERVAPELSVAAGAGDIKFVAPKAPGVVAAAAVAPPPPSIAKGEAIRLVSTAGPVRIERAVTALQDATGSRIFVRDEDGQVFAVRIGATRSAEDVR